MDNAHTPALDDKRAVRASLDVGEMLTEIAGLDPADAPPLADALADQLEQALRAEAASDDVIST